MSCLERRAGRGGWCPGVRRPMSRTLRGWGGGCSPAQQGRRWGRGRGPARPAAPVRRSRCTQRFSSIFTCSCSWNRFFWLSRNSIFTSYNPGPIWTLSILTTTPLKKTLCICIMRTQCPLTVSTSKQSFWVGAYIFDLNKLSANKTN